jgi:hypothetical protein
MEFTLQNQGGNTYVVCNLENKEIIDSFVYGMISNNTVKGVLPVIRTSMNGNVTLKYMISSKISVNSYFSERKSTRSEVLEFLNSVCDSVLDFQEYMLNIEEFMWDTRYMYMDIATKEAYLMCIPVCGSHGTDTFKQFLLDMVTKYEHSANENANYIVKILNFCSKNGQIHVKALKQLITELQENDKRNLSEGTVQVPKHMIEQQAINIPIPSSEPSATEKKTVEKKENEKKKFAGFFGVGKESFEKKGSSKRDSANMRGALQVNNPFEVADIQEKDTSSANFASQLNLKQEEDEKKDENPTMFMEELENKKTDVAGAHLIRQDGTKFFLTKDYTVIGRRSDCDVAIMDNKMVSGVHAAIIRRNHEYYIVDLRSTNHTRVNGELVKPEFEAKLSNADQIKIGNELLEFYIEQGD